MHADAEGAPGNQLGAAADMDEKELAQRDAHIRSFAIAQVLHIPRAYLTCWQCCRECRTPFNLTGQSCAGLFSHGSHFLEDAAVYPDLRL